METENITGKVKHWVILILAIPLISGAFIGYGAFQNNHKVTEITVADAKVTGTMISVRSLVDGKVSEFLFNDGDEVKRGNVIARLEVDINEETIAQLENTVELAKENLETLKLGQTVKVPVKKVRAITVAPSNNTNTPKNSNIASLEERADRMKELYEMGAVSKKEMDTAVSAYERARASGSYSVPSNSPEVKYVEEIEYIDQWQPTPPAALQNAENAIKQAELSLKVAQQQAQETEIIAPIDGTIYYIAESDKDLMAGNSIARIGDSNELWLEAEVSEEIFNAVTLGLPVDYVLDGNNLSGTIMEKIEPDIPEVEEDEFVSKWIPPTEDNPHPELGVADIEIKIEEPANEKYILKFSIPANFKFKPNTVTDVKVKIY